MHNAIKDEKFNFTVLFLKCSDQRKHCFSRYNLDIINYTGDQVDEGISFGLKSVFKKVIEYDYFKNYFDKGIYKTNSEIINIVKTETPHYVIWLPRDFILEETLSYIKKTGSFIVGYFSDDQTRFETQTIYWLPYIDYAVTIDNIKSIDKYRGYGVDAIFSPSGVSTQIFRKNFLNYKYDVSFIGLKYSDREEIVNSMINSGIRVNVFGSGWDSGRVSRSTMIDIFNSSKINLNFVKGYDCNCDQIKGRIFEVLACGGFLITEYVEGLEKFYDLDKEIVSYKSIPEAVSKIKYYLDHEDERLRIAEAGMKRTLENYTWENHLRSVFKLIENKNIKKNDLPPLFLPKYMKKERALLHEKMAYIFASEYDNDIWFDELKIAHCSHKLIRLKYLVLKINKYLPSHFVKQIFILLCYFDNFFLGIISFFKKNVIKLVCLQIFEKSYDKLSQFNKKVKK